MANYSLCSVIVDWQIKNDTNSRRARHLLDASLYTDCEFLVGDGEERKLFKAHKLFLALGSPVFEAMFFGGMAQGNANLLDTSGAIEVLDLQPSAFKDLLEYVYTEHVDLHSFDQACELWYAANKYIIPNLKNKCSEFMWEVLTPQNVCGALEFANLYDDALLKERSLNLIRCRTQDSLSSSAFENISELTLKMLVHDKALKMTEIELFQAIKRWAAKQCQRTQVEPNGSNMRQALKNVIPAIRFLTMTHEEFADDPARSGILSSEEILAIFVNLSSKNECKMPLDLSSSREPRAPCRTDSQSSSQYTKLNRFKGPRAANVGRMYCYRRVEDEKLVHNTGILHCGMPLIVDREVYIHGVVVSSQVMSEGEGSSVDRRSYKENLYCQLYCSDRTCLTDAHFTNTSAKCSSLEVIFNRPVYLKKNTPYRILVLYQLAGTYSYATASNEEVSEDVRFTFGSTSDDSSPVIAGTRDGLIRGVIFSF